MFNFAENLLVEGQQNNIESLQIWPQWPKLIHKTVYSGHRYYAIRISCRTVMFLVVFSHCLGTLGPVAIPMTLLATKVNNL